MEKIFHTMSDVSRKLVKNSEFAMKLPLQGMTSALNLQHLLKTCLIYTVLFMVILNETKNKNKQN